MADDHNGIQARLADVVEATRLTGAGRLQEASDLIQRSLFGSQPSEASASPAEIPTSRREAKTDGLPERLWDAVGTVARQFGFSPGHGFDVVDPAPRPQEEVVRERPIGEESFTERSFANDAGARNYKLFVPARHVARPPLVVMLHGCGQTPDDFAAGTTMNRLARSEGFLVAYPEQSARAHGQRCWNWYQPGDQGRDSGEAGIIAGLTRAVMDEYDIDPRRVYIAGLSAGGAAAANVARAYPDLYAAVGVHSGLAAGCAGDMSAALTTMRLGPTDLTDESGGDAARVPTIMIHGENDSTVHLRNGEHVLVQAGVGILDPSPSDGVSPGGLPYARTRYADTTGRVVVESWVVRGLAHAWSGGDASGSYTDPRGPDASRAMFEFFLAHRLDRPRH